MEISHEVQIARAPEAVFDFLVETDNFPVVDRALVDFAPRGRMSVGLRGTFVHLRGGMRARSAWQVSDLVRPRRIHVAVRGMGYEMDEVATLAPTPSGTLATFVDIVRATSLAGRLMVALSGRLMRLDLRRRAALLKESLEAELPSLRVDA